MISLTNTPPTKSCKRNFRSDSSRLMKMITMLARAADRTRAAGAVDGARNTIPEQTNNDSKVSRAFILRIQQPSDILREIPPGLSFNQEFVLCVEFSNRFCRNSRDQAFLFG